MKLNLVLNVNLKSDLFQKHLNNKQVATPLMRISIKISLETIYQ
jgi:hypothetical protein